MVLEAAVQNKDEIEKVRERYTKMKNSGDLERKLKYLNKKQKRAVTTSGPHPHHQMEQTSQSARQVTQIGGGRTVQQEFYEQPSRGAIGGRIAQ